MELTSKLADLEVDTTNIAPAAEPRSSLNLHIEPPGAHFESKQSKHSQITPINTNITSENVSAPPTPEMSPMVSSVSLLEPKTTLEPSRIPASVPSISQSYQPKFPTSLSPPPTKLSLHSSPFNAQPSSTQISNSSNSSVLSQQKKESYNLHQNSHSLNSRSHPEDWTTEEVCEWLSRAGFHSSVPHFSSM